MSPLYGSSSKYDILSHHYENMSVQFEALSSKSGKNDIFRCKNVTFFIFAQTIDCGYTLDLPR